MNHHIWINEFNMYYKNQGWFQGRGRGCPFTTFPLIHLPFCIPFLPLPIRGEGINSFITFHEMSNDFLQYISMYETYYMVSWYLSNRIPTICQITSEIIRDFSNFVRLLGDILQILWDVSWDLKFIRPFLPIHLRKHL